MPSDDLWYQVYSGMDRQVATHEKTGPQVAARLREATYQALKDHADKEQRPVAYIVRLVLEERFGA